MSRPRRSVGFVVGLGLACALGPVGCKRSADEAGEGAGHERGPAPLVAELWIAPVADAHPWVIALVTTISIERPPGTDARLEGLTGPGGARSPDPIIEGQDREALAAFLTSYEAAHPRPPELRAIWEAEPFGPGHRVVTRLHFIDQSRGFAVDDQARAALRRHDHGPSVHVQLGPAQTAALATLTAELVGHRLAVARGEPSWEALMVPVVMEAVADGDVQLLTHTSRDPEQTAPALLDQLTLTP